MKIIFFNNLFLLLFFFLYYFQKPNIVTYILDREHGTIHTPRDSVFDYLTLVPFEPKDVFSLVIFPIFT